MKFSDLLVIVLIRDYSIVETLGKVLVVGMRIAVIVTMVVVPPLVMEDGIVMTLLNVLILHPVAHILIVVLNIAIKAVGFFA